MHTNCSDITERQTIGDMMGIKAVQVIIKKVRLYDQIPVGIQSSIYKAIFLELSICGIDKSNSIKPLSKSSSQPICVLIVLVRYAYSGQTILSIRHDAFIPQCNCLVSATILICQKSTHRKCEIRLIQSISPDMNVLTVILRYVHNGLYD